MRRLLRYDDNLGKLIDLDESGVRKSGEELVEAIRNSPIKTATDGSSLEPLMAYGDAARNGKVTIRRDWDQDPMYGQFREGWLPKGVYEAYGKLTFYTHGLLRGPPEVVKRDGQTFAWIDCAE